MADEKIDKAKAVKDRFIHELNTIKTADEFRNFTISFFFMQEEKENMLNIIGLAELTGRNLGTWPAFMKLFRTVAYREFSRKMNIFITEEAKLGFML